MIGFISDHAIETALLAIFAASVASAIAGWRTMNRLLDEAFASYLEGDQ